MIRTGTTGIFQSDILIRAAVIEGLDEIRRNPWLLDYCFAFLPNDDLTAKTYGTQELEEAKQWFLQTEVNVTMAYRPDRPQLPLIAIELVESAEAHATLGDHHYDTAEDVLASEVAIKPNIALGPFTPTSYDPTTGKLTLPTDLSTSKVFVGMYVFDSVANKGYQIEDVSDTGFQIAPNTVANFTRCYVASRDSYWVIPLYSQLHRETYRLRCFVSSNPVHLSFLYSVLMFILLRGKKDLLEGRGFENSTMVGSGVSGTTDKDSPEFIFIRDITLTGLVRQYWPGTPHQKLDGVLVDAIKIIGGGTSATGIQQQVADQGWEMEDDQLQALKK